MRKTLLLSGLQSLSTTWAVCLLLHLMPANWYQTPVVLGFFAPTGQNYYISGGDFAHWWSVPMASTIWGMTLSSYGMAVSRVIRALAEFLNEEKS